MSSICCIRKRLKGSQCSQQLVFKKKKSLKSFVTRCKVQYYILNVVHKYYVLITSQFENHPRLKMRFTPRPEEMRKSVACHLMGGGIGRRRIIKALQSYRTNSVNVFAYSTPNLPVQPNS